MSGTLTGELSGPRAGHEPTLACLAPLPLADALALEPLALTLECAGGQPDAILAANHAGTALARTLDACQLVNARDGGALSLGRLCSPFNLDIAQGVLGARGFHGAAMQARYELGRQLHAQEDGSAAGVAFALCLQYPELRAAALCGLAGSLLASAAQALALELLQAGIAAGFDHPLPLALAGHAAVRLNDVTLTRQYLARAARRARGDESFRDLLRFAQHTLLMQQFGR